MIRGAAVSAVFHRVSAARIWKTLAKCDARTTTVLMSSSPRATWIHQSFPSSKIPRILAGAPPADFPSNAENSRIERILSF